MKINNSKLKFLISIMLFSIYTCENEDIKNSLSSSLSDSILQMTNNGSSNIWRIETAFLTNETFNNFDISNSTIITDDEFVFSSEIFETLTLSHKQRYGFNKNASTTDELLSNSYKSPINYNLNITTSNNTGFTDETGQISLVYENENLIIGEINYDSNSTLKFHLKPKLNSDFPEIPTQLNFETKAAFIVDNNHLNIGTVGFIGSTLNNSLYICYRNDFTNTQILNTEVLNIVDLNTNLFTRTFFENSDFTTKRLHFSSNALLAIGGSFVNFYDDNGNVNASNQYYFGSLSRFGSFQIDDKIYLVGGDLAELNSNKLWKFNDTYNDLELQATMPSAKTWAEVEVVDNEAYIFGGQQELNESLPESLSFIYNIENNTFTNFNLPYNLFVSYTAKFENLIFVSGEVRTDTNGDGITDENLLKLGVFNTEDFSYTEIQTNLDSNNDAFHTIYNMTILNGKLYIIYGDSTQTVNGEYMIMEANII